MAIHDWTFLFGPGFCVGVGNGIILGYLMLKSGLVPRRMAMLGLIGGPLVLIRATLILFDVVEPGRRDRHPGPARDPVGGVARPLSAHQGIQDAATADGGRLDRPAEPIHGFVADVVNRVPGARREIGEVAR